MPRAPDGTYTPPVDSFNPAIAGTPIDPVDWNATQDDYADALTDSLSRTGDGGMLADLELDAHAILASEIITPANPAADKLKIYAKDVGGITRLTTLDSAGNELSLTPSGGGSVTSFSAGNLSPLFTTNVATATTTPALTFSLTAAGATTYFGSIAGGAPSYVTGGSLTKTDDTNVTMTLGGTPANALLSTGVSMTLGWSGTLSTARGGTGVGALGDLTKADDTNVTLTLGGTPTGSLVKSVLVTAGWTGTLSPTRGGTGIANNAASTLSISGNFATTFTVTGITVVTLPTTGTLSTLAGAETLSNKTLTAPKFANGGFIADANGNEEIIFTTTASAVNEFTFSNAATAGSPTIAVSGGDTNIIGTLNGKGTGGITIKGTGTNDSAASGYVGEYIESVIAVGSAVSIVTATSKTITSISLPAGDWDVDMVCQFTGNTSTIVTAYGAGISLTNNTYDTTNGRTFGIYVGGVSVFNGFAPNIPIGIPIPQMRFSLSATTTIYMIAHAQFTISTTSGYGILRARRVR